MFALLGLIGLAVAGTAFVGVTSEPTVDDEPGTTERDADEAETLELSEAQDLLNQITTDMAGAETEVEGDVVVGTDAADTLSGTDGADYITTGGGDDTASGGGGDDQMHGGHGDDRMSGDAGDDLILGDLGDDDLNGGAGDDTLVGGSGSDLLVGGAGDDVLQGGYDDDDLIGGAGEDNLQGSDGNDRIDGATGEDVAQRDYLNGSEGTDHLIGNNGDVMSGGTDADIFEVHSGTVSIMDYSDEDVLVLNYEGQAPLLTTQSTADGMTLLADGVPVAALYGVSSFDVGSVQLVAG